MKQTDINISKLIVRTLSGEDADIVSELDNMTDEFTLAPEICGYEPDESSFAWGIFYEDKLIGYCTVGGADCVDDDDDIAQYPGYTTDALILSTVFIVPEYRNIGLGTYFIEKVLKIHEDVPGNLVFLNIEEYRLSYFYKKLGFQFTSPSDKEIGTGSNNDNDMKVMWTMVKHC